MADDTLQRLLAATDPAEKAALVARSVLANGDSVLAELVPVLAFLRWFDEPVVAALLPESERPRSTELFVDLTELPFVERVSYGYALHDLTRKGLHAQAPIKDRITASQAAYVYAQNGNPQDLLESLYCFVIGEQSNNAQRLLEKQIRAIAASRDYASFQPLFSTIEEAESLIKFLVVEPTALQWVARGLICNALGEHQEAIANYDRAIDLQPEYAAAYNNRGTTHDELGNYSAAIADYDRAIALDSEYANAYGNRGKAHRSLGKYQAAIADYNRAIAFFSDSKDAASAYTNRGSVYYALGEHRAAIADYDQAIVLNPQYIAAYNNRGNAHYALGERRAAIADYDRAIALNPQYAKAYFNRSGVHAASGQLIRAIKDLLNGVRQSMYGRRSPIIRWKR